MLVIGLLHIKRIKNNERNSKNHITSSLICQYFFSIYQAMNKNIISLKIFIIKLFSMFINIYE